jgi:hypothetical protein
MFPALPDFLRLAEQHVLDAERSIVLQRHRIDRLRAVGADISDAQALLSTFSNTLLVMQRHLRVARAGQALQQRLAIARALARQKLNGQSEVVTDEAVEREAAPLMNGLFVQGPQNGIALTTQALKTPIPVHSPSTAISSDP